MLTLTLSIAVFLVTRNLSAGPLVEKHRAEQASAVAGVLTAQQVMRPFNPVGPFVDHYYRQYANEGFVRTPVSPAQMNLLKGRLVWEYGPLSSKALGYVENLNDIVFAISRENPSLLKNPAELADEITRKIGNLSSREASFKGYQAEAHEARILDWKLIKDAQAEVADLLDPSTKLKYQSKVWKTSDRSFGALKKWWNEKVEVLVPGHARKFYFGRMPADQIDELVRAGKLKIGPSILEGTRNGVRLQQTYFDPNNPELKITALKSEPTAKQLQENVSKGYAIEKRLSQRPAGFGNAVVGGFVVGTGGSLAFQIYQGEDVNWGMVGEAGGIDLASSAATVILAQQLEQRFGRQLAQSFIAKNMLPGLGRGALSGAGASTGVGSVVVLGFVAKDYFTDQITFNEAVIHSGIGLGSVGVGVGASVIAAWAVGGSAAGPFGTAAGAIVGTAVYLGGEWYYETFKLERARAEMAAFKQAASEWEAKKIEMEIKSLRESASKLRKEAAGLLR